MFLNSNGYALKDANILYKIKLSQPFQNIFFIYEKLNGSWKSDYFFDFLKKNDFFHLKICFSAEFCRPMYFSLPDWMKTLPEKRYNMELKMLGKIFCCFL